MINPWLGIVLVMLALGGLLSGLALLQKFYPKHPELLRKLLHIGMGLVAMTFPWVFAHYWPVLFLAVVAIAVLLFLKRHTMDKTGIRHIVHGVARDSLGEIYFPISIAILFILSKGHPLLYTIPLLILTLADAVAALIGVRYGRLRFNTADGVKTTEGSMAFFMVTFLSVHIPLLLLSHTGRAETLLIACILGVLVMLLEALAWRGLDNLLIPLGGYLLLKAYLEMDAADLLLRLFASVILLVFVIIWRKKTTLIDSAALAAAVVGYLAWAAGDWRWLIPVLLVFITYTMLTPKDAMNSSRYHDVRAVLAVSLPGLLWLFVARSESWPALYFAFTLSFAIQLSLIGLARLNFQKPQLHQIWLWFYCIGLGSAIIFIPWLLLTGLTWATLMYVMAGLVLVSSAVISFYFWQPGMEDCPTDTPRWWRQGGIGLFYSACSVPMIIYFPLN